MEAYKLTPRDYILPQQFHVSRNILRSVYFAYSCKDWTESKNRIFLNDWKDRDEIIYKPDWQLGQFWQSS